MNFYNLFTLESTVLNQELPFTSRMKKVEAFNKGAIAIVIATDPQGGVQIGDDKGAEEIEEGEEEGR